MVNDFRTYLMNVSGSQNAMAGYPGEEFVTPTFVARHLPGPLRRVHEVLFGKDADRALRNWRLRELMGLLHAGELAGFITANDPRVTYLPFNTSLLDAYLLGAVASPLVNTGQTLTWVGSRYVPQYGNSIYLQWLLQVLDGANAQVTAYLPDGPVVTVIPYSTSGNLSSIVNLPGTSLGVRFTAGSGSSWQISALARPARSLPAVLADMIATVDGEAFTALFGVNPAEPYLTFQNLWQQHDQLPYRLGGLVLALGYQIGALPN